MTGSFVPATHRELSYHHPFNTEIIDFCNRTDLDGADKMIGH